MRRRRGLLKCGDIHVSAGTGDVVLGFALCLPPSLALHRRPPEASPVQSESWLGVGREFDELLTFSAGRPAPHLHLAIPICARISIGRMLRAGRGTFV